MFHEWNIYLVYNIFYLPKKNLFTNKIHYIKYKIILYMRRDQVTIFFYNTRVTTDIFKKFKVQTIDPNRSTW
jgi:hypothetical protein